MCMALLLSSVPRGTPATKHVESSPMGARLLFDSLLHFLVNDLAHARQKTFSKQSDKVYLECHKRHFPCPWYV